MADYYFNTRTGTVQTTADKGQSKELLGPYPTREAATQALQTAHERTEDWDREDQQWQDKE